MALHPSKWKRLYILVYDRASLKQMTFTLTNQMSAYQIQIV